MPKMSQEHMEALSEIIESEVQRYRRGIYRDVLLSLIKSGGGWNGNHHTQATRAADTATAHFYPGGFEISMPTEALGG